MTKPILFSCALFLVVSIAGAGDDEIKADLKKLQGTWKVVQAIDKGEKVASDDIASLAVIFEGQKILVREKDGDKEGDKGKIHDRMTFKLDPSKKPKAIDLTHVEGVEKDKTDAGIYKLEGDTLTICVNEKAGGDRPTEFASKPGSTFSLIVLKRAK